VAENSAEQQKKKPRGRPFKPGVSGNPGGRPKGFAALIRERTHDGEELVDLAVRIARGELSVAGEEGDTPQVPSIKERFEAVKFLASYVAGLPVQSVEHAGAGGGALSFTIVRKVGK
jgi:hypothetical protein